MILYNQLFSAPCAHQIRQFKPDFFELRLYLCSSIARNKKFVFFELRLPRQSDQKKTEPIKMDSVSEWRRTWESNPLTGITPCTD